MHKTVVAQIYPDMRESMAQGVVEHQIAGPQLFRCDRFAKTIYFPGVVRQIDAQRLAEYVPDKAAA